MKVSFSKRPFFQILHILLFLLFCCCNNDGVNTSKDLYIQIYESHTDEGTFVSDKSELSDIDSVTINVKMPFFVRFKINSPNYGTVCMIENNTEAFCMELTEDFCERQITAIDELFVRRQSPVIVSRLWTGIVTGNEGFFMEFIIYSEGKKYRRVVDYFGHDHGFKVEYSNTLKTLSESLYLVSDDMKDRYMGWGFYRNVPEQYE